jgi:hypothetical protein
MKPTIGKTTEGIDLAIDLPKLMRSKLLLQANSGGGKSYMLRLILEQTHGKVQQVMIDTEGEFLTLREKFDYVYCAPTGGDAVATPGTATLLARRLRETRVSAIIDIYELPLPQRQKFVRRFIEEFMAAPKKLWHPCLIALDEAQDYCPESGKGESESKAAVIDVQARGRKRGLCTILATQRLAKLSKDAAAECQNKLIGLTTLPDDQDSAAKELGMKPKDSIQILRNLEPGHFFAYGPALSKTVVEVFGGPVQTKHPEVGEKLPPLPAPSEKIKKVRHRYRVRISDRASRHRRPRGRSMERREVRMKVSELDGAELDYWVARALGANARIEHGCYMPLNLSLCFAEFENRDDDQPFSPSNVWEDAGPIIVREQIGFNPTSAGDWCATDYLERPNHAYGRGPTPLIAAMRCFVASKFGEEVGTSELST